MKKTKIYDEAFILLVEEFIEKYYTYDDWSKQDYYVVGGFGRYSPHTVWIWDQFRSINDIYEALLHEITLDKLFERYEYSLNKHTINDKGWNETIVNLVNFYKWDIEYTKEDEEKDNKRISESYKLLAAEIEKWE